MGNELTKLKNPIRYKQTVSMKNHIEDYSEPGAKADTDLGKIYVKNSP